MKRYHLLVFVLLTLLFLSACSQQQANDVGNSEGSASPSVVDNTTAPPQATATQDPYAEDLQNIPGVASLEVSHAVIGYGETLEVQSNEPLDGTLEIHGPQEFQTSADMADGKALLTFEKDAPAGLYWLTLNTPEGDFASGMFRLADKPGIWLTVDRTTIQPDGRARLGVTSWGIPSDTPAALEFKADGLFNSLDLKPDPQTNELMPASVFTELSLQDFTGQTWLLPAGTNGILQLSAGEDPTDEDTATLSNEVAITMCETPGIIRGDIGSPGIVKAVWMADGIQSTSVAVENGQFNLSAGPGLVLVEVLNADGSALPEKKQMAVRLECGQSKDIGSLDLTLAESIQQAYPFLGMSPEDLSQFTLSLQTDQEIQQAGMADCYLSDGILNVSMDPGDEVFSFYQMDIPGATQSGTYQAVFNWMDFDLGEATGEASVDLVIDQVDDLMGVKGSFQSSFSGDMGDGQASGEFTCTYFPPMASNQAAEIQYAAGETGGKPLLSLVPRMTQAGQTSEACRSGFVVYPNDEISPALGEYFATQLHQSNLRLDVLSLGDAQALLGLQAERLLLGADESEVESVISALAGALNTDFVFWVRMDQLGESYTLTLSAMRTRDGKVVDREMASGTNLEEVAFSSVYQDMIQKLPKADICAEVDPSELTLKHEEKADLSFILTDLAGQDVSSASVETSETKCGTLDPAQGNTEQGEFQTSYTANDETEPCEEQLVFTATADVLGGQVESKPEEGTVEISVADQWLLEMTLAMGDGTDQVDINWSGSFHVNENGKLVGSGNGSLLGELPNYPCVILDFDHGDIYQEPNPTTLRSDFVFYIYGDAAQQDQQSSFQIEPLAANVPLTYTFSNQKCAADLTYDIFTGPFFSMVAKQPTIAIGQSYFEMPAEDSSQSFPTSGLPNTTLDLSIQRSN